MVSPSEHNLSRAEPPAPARAPRYQNPRHRNPEFSVTPYGSPLRKQTSGEFTDMPRLSKIPRMVGMTRSNSGMESLQRELRDATKRHSSVDWSSTHAQNTSAFLNLDKPLPSAPIARVLNSTSPPKAQRTLIDAHVAGAPDFGKWPAIMPVNISPKSRPSSLMTVLPTHSSSPVGHATDIPSSAPVLLKDASNRFSASSSTYSTATDGVATVHALTTPGEQAEVSPMPFRISSKRSSLPVPVTSNFQTIGVALTAASRHELGTPGEQKSSVVDAKKCHRSLPAYDDGTGTAISEHKDETHNNLQAGIWAPAHDVPMSPETFVTAPSVRRSKDSDEWSMAAGSSLDGEEADACESSTRVKYLSNHAPQSGFGPRLTIMPEADTVILGQGDGIPDVPPLPSARSLSSLASRASRSALSRMSLYTGSRSTTPRSIETRESGKTSTGGSISTFRRIASRTMLPSQRDSLQRQVYTSSNPSPALNNQRVSQLSAHNALTSPEASPSPYHRKVSQLIEALASIGDSSSPNNQRVSHLGAHNALASPEVSPSSNSRRVSQLGAHDALASPEASPSPNHRRVSQLGAQNASGSIRITPVRSMRPQRASSLVNGFSKVDDNSEKDAGGPVTPLINRSKSAYTRNYTDRSTLKAESTERKVSATSRASRIPVPKTPMRQLSSSSISIKSSLLSGISVLFEKNTSEKNRHAIAMSTPQSATPDPITTAPAQPRARMSTKGKEPMYRMPGNTPTQSPENKISPKTAGKKVEGNVEYRENVFDRLYCGKQNRVSHQKGDIGGHDKAEKMKAKRSFRNLFHVRDGKPNENDAKPVESKRARASLIATGKTTLARRFNFSFSKTPLSNTPEQEMKRAEHKPSRMNLRAKLSNLRQEQPSKKTPAMPAAMDDETATLLEKLAGRVDASPEPSEERLRALQITEAFVHAYESSKQAKLSAVEAMQHARQAELSAERARLEVDRLEGLLGLNSNGESARGIKALVGHVNSHRGESSTRAAGRSPSAAGPTPRATGPTSRVPGPSSRAAGSSTRRH